MGFETVYSTSGMQALQTVPAPISHYLAILEVEAYLNDKTALSSAAKQSEADLRKLELPSTFQRQLWRRTTLQQIQRVIQNACMQCLQNAMLPEGSCSAEDFKKVEYFLKSLSDPTVSLADVSARFDGSAVDWLARLAADLTSVDQRYLFQLIKNCCLETKKSYAPEFGDLESALSNTDAQKSEVSLLFDVTTSTLLLDEKAASFASIFRIDANDPTRITETAAVRKGSTSELVTRLSQPSELSVYPVNFDATETLPEALRAVVSDLQQQLFFFRLYSALQQTVSFSTVAQPLAAPSLSLLSQLKDAIEVLDAAAFCRALGLSTVPELPVVLVGLQQSCAKTSSDLQEVSLQLLAHLTALHTEYGATHLHVLELLTASAQAAMTELPVPVCSASANILLYTLTTPALEMALKNRTVTQKMPSLLAVCDDVGQLQQLAIADARVTVRPSQAGKSHLDSDDLTSVGVSLSAANFRSPTLPTQQPTSTFKLKRPVLGVTKSAVMEAASTVTGAAVSGSTEPRESSLLGLLNLEFSSLSGIYTPESQQFATDSNALDRLFELQVQALSLQLAASHGSSLNGVEVNSQAAALSDEALLAECTHTAAEDTADAAERTESETAASDAAASKTTLPMTALPSAGFIRKTIRPGK